MKQEIANSDHKFSKVKIYNVWNIYSIHLIKFDFQRKNELIYITLF